MPNIIYCKSWSAKCSQPLLKFHFSAISAQTWTWVTCTEDMRHLCWSIGKCVADEQYCNLKKKRKQESRTNHWIKRQRKKTNNRKVRWVAWITQMHSYSTATARGNIYFSLTSSEEWTLPFVRSFYPPKVLHNTNISRKDYVTYITTRIGFYPLIGTGNIFHSNHSKENESWKFLGQNNHLLYSFPSNIRYSWTKLNVKWTKMVRAMQTKILRLSALNESLRELWSTNCFNFHIGMKNGWHGPWR